MKSVSVENIDLEKINQYTRRELSQEEVYSFNVCLCDNDVDRDFECFSIEALQSLALLFVGKTGIFDHDPKGKNQSARIYSTEVVTDLSKTTSYGEAYCALNAKAYMVRSEKNADLILDIDAGIKKEVSVGCSVGDKVCSICGTNIRATTCEHIGGEQYGGKLCYTILKTATDAYEWSFVAIPAQKNAGVIKAFNAKKEVLSMDLSLEEIKKRFNSVTEDITISKKSASCLVAKIEALEELASLGKTYLNDLQQHVIKLSFLAGNEINGEVFGAVVSKMNLAELKAFERSYERTLSITDKQFENNFYQGQLPIKEKTMDGKNDSFKI